MLIKKYLLVFSFCFFCGINLIAQSNYEVPKYVKPVSKSDSLKLETDLIKAAKWIKDTDLNKEQATRKAANSFVLQWYINNIGLNIKLVEKLSSINEGNSDLLLVYFAGASNYYLENKLSNVNSEMTKAGLISVMNVYKKGIGITKSKGIDNLIKITEQNELDKYLSDNFNKE